MRLCSRVLLFPQALQRHLPRPASLDLVIPAAKPAADRQRMSLRERAEEALVQELATLLQYDEAKYPVVVSKDKQERKSKAKAAAAVPPLPVRVAAHWCKGFAGRHWLGIYVGWHGQVC